jgi:putative aldouronate transport system permease protein
MKGNRFRKAVQLVTYIPYFISTVVLLGIIFQLFNPITGLYGFISKFFSGVVPPAIISDPNAFPHLYVWSGVWQGMGFSSIIYVAALSAVDPELHEAAIIDGASRVQRIIHIDFPTIAPTVIIMLIMAAGGILGVGFEKVFLMQFDLNLRVSEVISTYTYKVGLASGAANFSYSTAIGLFNSVVSFVLLVTVNFIVRKIDESSSLF